MDNPLHLPRNKVLIALLRRFRDEKGMTQAELAAKLNTSQSTIGKCERGERILGFVEVEEWCKALNYPFEDFVRLYIETPVSIIESP